jgi:Flp pilus assembly protein CpaB
MTYRMRNILIAVGLALAAALLTVFYVSNYKSSVQSKEETVNVLVASRDIPVGTLGSQVVSEKMLTVQEVPRKAIVAGTISKPEELQGLIATQPVYIGEQVTARRFGPIAQAGVRTQLKGTYRAMRIQGNPNQLLSGTLKPGDHVDVVANVKFPTEDSSKHFAKVVLRDVLVLETDEASQGASVVDPTGGNGSVMLRVTDTQAEKLYFVYANNDWWLALRPGLNGRNSAESVEDAISILRAGLSKDAAKSRLKGGG